MAEYRLWYELRDRQLAGFKFRRQHPIGPYITDFCCMEKRLIIEIDGEQHASPAMESEDANRTRFLEALGFRVIRFWNHEVLGDRTAVLERIFDAIKTP